jgi:hypothetical protein
MNEGLHFNILTVNSHARVGELCFMLVLTLKFSTSKPQLNSNGYCCLKNICEKKFTCRKKIINKLCYYFRETASYVRPQLASKSSDFYEFMVLFNDDKRYPLKDLMEPSDHWNLKKVPKYIKPLKIATKIDKISLVLA